MEINPDTPNHKALLNELRSHLQSKNRAKTPDILEDIHPFTPPEGNTWSKDYLRAALGGARKFLERQGEIRVEEEKTQNIPTKIWIAKDLDV